MWNILCFVSVCQSTVRKKMAAVHLTTIPCESNAANNGNGNGIYIPHFLYVYNQMRFTFNHPTHES